MEEQTLGLADNTFSKELVLVPMRVDSMKVLEVNVGSQGKEGELSEGWSSSCLAKFS